MAEIFKFLVNGAFGIAGGTLIVLVLLGLYKTIHL